MLTDGDVGFEVNKRVETPGYQVQRDSSLKMLPQQQNIGRNKVIPTPY